MEIDTILISKIFLLGFIHWMLVPLALQALIERRRVFGARKAPWAIAIIFLTCIGSLLYLMFHPQTQIELEPQAEREL